MRRRDRAAADPVRLAHLTTVDLSLHVLLATELRIEAAAGLEVFGLSAPGPHREAIEALGVTVVDITRFTRRWSPRDDLAAARELWHVLPRLDLDVLHTHTPKAGVLGRMVGRLRGVPVVVHTCHGLAATPDDRWLKRLVVYAVEGLGAQFSDAELFQNPDDQRTMRFAIPSRRSVLAGNGVDLERFRFDADARARVRAELGVHDGEVLVGGVGRRVAEKGLHDFAAAARRLDGRARFVWVGPEEPDKADAVSGSLAGVQLVGHRDDMPAIYSALDVFVLPSYREGFPRSAMEAAACGRALVLTDIRGSREIGSEGAEVSFVRPGDDAALAEAIECLVADADLRARRGRAARTRALAHFDQRRVARTSLRTYWSVARRRGLDWPLGPPDV